MLRFYKFRNVACSMAGLNAELYPIKRENKLCLLPKGEIEPTTIKFKVTRYRTASRRYLELVQNTEIIERNMYK